MEYVELVHREAVLPRLPDVLKHLGKNPEYRCRNTIRTVGRQILAYIKETFPTRWSVKQQDELESRVPYL